MLSVCILSAFTANTLNILLEKHQPLASPTRLSQALNFLACLLCLSQQGLQKQH